MGSLTWYLTRDLANSKTSPQTSGAVNEEYFARLDFNDSDVRKVFIDWGDGDNQTKEDGIYEWFSLENPASFAIVSHIYTKAGAFSPIVRTINSAGFVSKYFGEASSGDEEPYEELSGAARITEFTVNDDKPLSILRIENKTVMSGIDNTIFQEGGKDIFLYIPPLLTLSDALVHTSGIELEVIYEAYATDQEDIAGQGYIKKTTIIGIDPNDPFKKINAAGERALRILEVKITNPRTSVTRAQKAERRKMRFFIVAENQDSIVYPITYVSYGSPVKKYNDYERQVVLDLSESRTPASNKSISSHWYDDGKIFMKPWAQWQTQLSGSTLNFVTNMSHDLLTDSNNVPAQYTYTPRPDGLLGSGSNAPFVTSGATGSTTWHYAGTGSNVIRAQFAMDDFGRFYPSYRLVRSEAKSSSNKLTDLDYTTEVIRVEYPTSGVYEKITPALLTSGAFLNGSGNEVNTNDWNGATIISSGSKYEYMIILLDDSTDRLFFNTSIYHEDFENNLSGMVSGSIDPVEIVGLFYLNRENEGTLAEKVQWKPLPFVDTTKISREHRGASRWETVEESLGMSGYIKWDKPDDWDSMSLTDLTGGYFLETGAVGSGQSPAVGEGPLCSGVWAGPAVAQDSDNYWFKEISGVTGALTSFSANDIGNYKYYIHVVEPSGTNEGRCFWIAGDSIAPGVRTNGWDPATATLTIRISKTAFAPYFTDAGGGGFNFTVTKASIYDVIDGVEKIDNTNGAIPDGSGSYFPYHWMFPTGAVATQLEGSWVGQYPLKIVLKGDHFKDSASNDPGIELWNIIPHDNSYSQVVKEIDDSAYDLSIMDIISDISYGRSAALYTAITRKGKVFIARTGTPLQKITLHGKALGDYTFAKNKEGTPYGDLRLLRRIEAENVRCYWDEKQKDGTFVRFWGIIESLAEKETSGGNAPKDFDFTLVIEYIAVMDATGKFITDIEPIGGVKDARSYT